METFKNIFDSFKEFVWDIIGYFIPGSYLLIILYFSINSRYFISSSVDEFSNSWFFIFSLLSYLIGYMVYGFSMIKERILGKNSYVKKSEEKLQKRETFILAKELILEELKAKGISNLFTVRDLRSVAMSYMPEQDQKIYTFTFRAELSNLTANISIVIGSLGLISSIFHKCLFDIFIRDFSHVILYVLMILSYFLLRETRNRFYDISLGLPFSIYLAKVTKK